MDRVERELHIQTPEDLSSIVEQLKTITGSRQETEQLQKEVKTLRREVDELKELLAAMGIKMDTPKEPVATPQSTAIIAGLRKECRGNPHVKDIINISGSNTGSCDGRCYRVIDYGWNGTWCTRDKGESWIQFDFRDRCVSIDSYSIKSDGYDCALIQWQLGGSNDEKNWTLLDSQNTRALCSEFTTVTFNCTQKVTDFFRYVRLMQTGPSSNNNMIMCLSEVEFFGAIKPTEN